MVGGRIKLYFLKTGETYVAADAGDYVYPSDVRLNAESELLYVKAHGLAGGVREETWLFEYDLRARKLISRIPVRNGSLPPECPTLETGDR